MVIFNSEGVMLSDLMVNDGGATPMLINIVDAIDSYLGTLHQEMDRISKIKWDN